MPIESVLYVDDLLIWNVHFISETSEYLYNQLNIERRGKWVSLT